MKVYIPPKTSPFILPKKFQLERPFPIITDIFGSSIYEGSIILKYDNKRMRLFLVLGFYKNFYYCFDSDLVRFKKSDAFIISNLHKEEISRSIIFSNSLFYLNLPKIAVILEIIDLIKDHPYNVKGDFFLSDLTKEQILQGDVNVEV